MPCRAGGGSRPRPTVITGRTSGARNRPSRRGGLFMRRPSGYCPAQARSKRGQAGGAASRETGRDT